MRPIKCGIIGLGRIGKIHLENIVHRIPGAEVLAVSDVSSEARDYASKRGIKEVYSDAKKVLDHPEIKAVIISSPTDTHANYVKHAARMQKDIFCEKPLDLNLETISEITQIVDSHGVMLMVGFNRRFDPSFSKVHRAVRDGHLGQLQLLRITSRDPAPPSIDYIQSSGGIFLDMTIHDFDMARYITGSEVTEVYTKSNAFDQGIEQADDVDTAITTLYFENGAIAAIDNSRRAVYGYDQRLEVFGSLGMMTVANDHGDNQTFYDSQGTHKTPLLHFFLERYQQAYVNMMQAFVDTLSNGKTSLITPHDGFMSTAIAVAANKSRLENRPVKICEVYEK